MSRAARAIEEIFRRRFGREALYLPSGRFALYIAFREWLRPGDRLLMSPVNDDVVFFTVLAAGLVPVLAPVDPGTGNLDPLAIDGTTWASLQAVMTTNLYGVPDRMDVLEDRCRQHGLVLVEDACHAFDSHFGDRRIGEFGPVAAYSLSKHLQSVGGVLTFADASRRASLARRAHRELRYRPPHLAIADRVRPLFRTLRKSGRAGEWVGRLRDKFQPQTVERDGHRMPYRIAQVHAARASGGGLDRFDRWVRVDYGGYRTPPLRSQVRAAFQRLESFDENRHRRLAGAEKLLKLGLTPVGLPVSPDAALFRVPLFVREREAVLRDFGRRGLWLDYIYDPPLDLYAPELAESLPSPPTARAWSRDVLPVDPLLADRFLGLLEQSPALCELPPEL